MEMLREQNKILFRWHETEVLRTVVRLLFTVVERLSSEVGVFSKRYIGLHGHYGIIILLMEEIITCHIHDCEMTNKSKYHHLK